MEDFNLDNFLSDIPQQDPKSDRYPKKAHEGGSTCVPGHLNSPIYTTEIDLLLNCDKKNLKCRRHRMIYKELFDNNQFPEWPVVSLLSLHHDYVGYLTNFILKRVMVNPIHTEKNFQESFSYMNIWVMQYINFHQVEYPNRRAGTETYKNLYRYCQGILNDIKQNSYDLYIPFKNMKIAEHLKDNLTYQETERGRFSSLAILNGKIQCERDLTIITDNLARTRIILPTTMFLCVIDTLQCRFPLLLYWKICDVFKKYPNINMYSRGTELIKIFEDLRTKIKKNFFSFMGSWEALVIGYVISDPDDIGCKALYETQYAEMSEILNESNVPNTVLTQILPLNRSSYEYMFLLEMIGISKCFGYPILHDDKLLNQLKEFGQRPQYRVNFDTVQEVDNISRREFLINYYKKEKHLPNLEYVPPIIRSLLSKKNFSERKLRSIPLDSWSTLKFAKTLDYDFTPDQTTLIKDSSSAPNLSAWSIQYDRCAFHHLYNKPPPPPGPMTSNLRTIHAFLTSEEDHVRTLIREREMGIYSEQDHVSVQCGKERELKEESGRAFTKQTANHRLIQTSMEHNIACKVFPYVPEQSMIDGEVKLVVKMMYQARQLHKERCEFVCLDLKKFCIHEIATTNIRVGLLFDELFGLNGLFENSHKSFIDCNIFTNNRLTPPDYNTQTRMPIPGPYFMNRYVGGFEGMHQKKWTFVAISAIRLAIEKCKIKAQSMGQGDNQIIIIEHNPTHTKEEKTTIRLQFLNILEKTFKDLNLKLKEKETWYSRHLYEYGKNRVYKGCCISLGTKKCTRVQPDINDGLCSITSCMSTINTLTEAISKGDSSPHPAFLLNCVMQGNFIKRKKITSDECSVMGLLLTPNDFGGLPVSTLYSHMVRGHCDNITLWISIFQTIKQLKIYQPVFRQLEKLWHTHPNSPASSSIERSHLYEDPYSLNIPQLPTADPIIKEKTLEYLKSDDVTNPMIVRLHKSSATHSKESIIAIIDQMDPCYPQIGHELLVNSNAGLLIRMQQKFTSNKTIEQVVGVREDISLLGLIHQKNSELIGILRRRFHSTYSRIHSILYTNTCVVEIADKLRLLSWGKTILFVSKSYYGCQVSVIPTDAVKESEIGNSILVNVNDECFLNPYALSHSFGKFKPYIGSTTREKMKKQAIDFGEKTSFTIAFENIRRMKSWFTYMKWEGLTSVADILLKEKTSAFNFDITELLENEKMPQILSGNIVHRFQSEMESSYALLNGLPSITSNFLQSTNLLRDMTKHGEDWTIFYQLIFISNIALLTSIMHRDKHLQPFYYVRLDCNSCTREIETKDLEAIDFKPKSEIKSISSIPLSIPNKTTMNYDPQEVYLAMSHAVGRWFGVNIDENFRHFHKDISINSTSASPITFDISMNDLKKLNISIIVCTMISNSQHCLKMINDSSLLKCYFNDKSFMFFAECIMNSGKQHELIKLMGINIIEHSSITKIENFSYLISQYIQSFFFNNVRAHMQCYYLVQFSECIITRRVIIESLFRKFMNEHCPDLNRPLTKELSHMQLYHKLKYIFKLHPIIQMQFEEYDITYFWRCIRSQNIEFDNLEKFYIKREKKQQIPDCGNLTFNIIPIKQYWMARTQDNEYNYNFPFLSFLTRAFGTLSSAATKYIEIIFYLNLEKCQNLSRDETIYCLAEGAGGTLSTLAYLFPNAKLGYNTLNTVTIDPKDDVCFILPPAILDSDHNLTERIVYGRTLNSGVTDILNPIFYKKLKDCLETHPPLCVTMDAESLTSSSNMSFVYALFPVILKYNPKFLIFKMFFISDIEILVEKFMNENQFDLNYEWLFYKPISSNPCGFEIFLIVIHRNYKNITNNINQMRKDGICATTQYRLRNFKKEYLSFGLESLTTYICTSQSILKFYMSHFQNTPIILKNRYSNLMSNKKICSLGCKKLFARYFLHFGEISDHAKQDPVLAIIREGGTVKNSFRSMLDFVFLSIRLGKKDNFDLVGVIFALNNIVTSEVQFDNYRYGKEKTPLKVNTDGIGNFFSLWNDKKIHLQDLLISSYCNCKKEILQIREETFNNRYISTDLYRILTEIYEMKPLTSLLDIKFYSREEEKNAPMIEGLVW